MEELERLAEMSLKELQAEWVWMRGTESPRVASAEFLRYSLAWDAQAKCDGGLSAKARRRLKQLTEAYERDPEHQPSAATELRPGVVLVREWQGKPHRVRVLDDGFEYGGERFRSLSQVARAITGTRWSGPLFFGLRGSSA